MMSGSFATTRSTSSSTLYRLRLKRTDPCGGGEGHAHRAEDVRGFQRAGGAGRAAAGADAEAVEHQQDRLALDELETDVGRVGQTIRGVAVDVRIGTGLQQSGFELVTQGLHARVLVLHVLRREFTGFAQADDAGDVFRTRPPAAFLVAAETGRA